jgi:hypothetical protein
MKNVSKLEELSAKMMRVMFMQQIQLYNLDDLKEFSFCPVCIKKDIGKSKAAMIQMKGTFIKELPTATANLLRKELSSDRAHAINMIFDKLHTIENLDDVYEWMCSLTKVTKNEAA